jgi:hypothetical protein
MGCNNTTAPDNINNKTIKESYSEQSSSSKHYYYSSGGAYSSNINEAHSSSISSQVLLNSVPGSSSQIKSSSLPQSSARSDGNIGSNSSTINPISSIKWPSSSSASNIKRDSLCFFWSNPNHPQDTFYYYRYSYQDDKVNYTAKWELDSTNYDWNIQNIKIQFGNNPECFIDYFFADSYCSSDNLERMKTFTIYKPTNVCGLK